MIKTMTEADARKHLKDINYTPGKSKTVDMAPDLKAKTKLACKTVKAADRAKAIAAEKKAAAAK